MQILRSLLIGLALIPALGMVAFAQTPQPLPPAPGSAPAIVRAERDGYVRAIDTVALGERARDLVAASGPGAGIVFGARIGDRVARGDALAETFGGDAASVAAVARAVSIGDDAAPPRPLVYGEIEAVSDSAARASDTGDASRSMLESR